MLHPDGSNSTFRNFSAPLRQVGSSNGPLAPPLVTTNGIVYVQSGQPDTTGMHLNALNQDGSDRWQVRTNGKPVIGSDGTVYVSNWDEWYDPDQHQVMSKDSLMALSEADGSLLWE